MSKIQLIIAMAIVSAASVVEAQTRARGVARPPQPDALERVLMPFVGEAQVGGQYWASQFRARNGSDDPITMFFPFPCRIGTGCPPNQPFTLEPGQLLVNPTYAGSRGVFLHVEKNGLRKLHYTLRVEDISGLVVVGRVFLGTELPLVKEEQFSSEVTLLNVPVTGGAETFLRVYASTSAATPATIEIYSSVFEKELLLMTEQVILEAGKRIDDFEAHPAFAMVDLTSVFASIADQAEQGRLSVKVISNSGAELWAFLAVTEQGDRSFTAITPGR
ncbi:MAG TPA: hypothetical protein VMO47_01155 [Rhodothermales bacterium]|nr:hypothetical protein [Rhodothermales bacterium]